MDKLTIPTEDGTFLMDAAGTVRNIAQDFAAGFVVALEKLNSALDARPGYTFGRWTDTDGTVYWDRVAIVTDLELALSVGRERGELAIWDLAEGKEIRC